MSVTAATLSAIQQAGQAIDVARQSLAEAVQEHAQRVMMAVADQPFSVGNDKLFSQWKTVARLAQEVQAIEEQFKALYQTASDMAEPEAQVLKALPHAARTRATGPQGTYAMDTSAAEDVQVKPAPAAKGPRSAKAGKAARRQSAPRSRGGNDAKVLNFLKTTLNRKSWKRLTQSEMADGAGIPNGSIAVSVRRLTDSGTLREGEKGFYKLA